MTIEKEQLRINIISELLNYYAKTNQSQVTIDELLIEAKDIEDWVTRK